MNDRELAREFLGTGSEAAFRLLYDAHTPDVYRFALRISGGDAMLADDLIQAMWIIAIERLPTFRWASALRSWLIGIVVNLYREELRKRRRDVGQERDDTAERFDESMNIDLQTAFDALPPGCRQVFLLHDWEGWTHREIAAMLEIDEGTSKSQLNYARTRLRKFLGRK